MIICGRKENHRKQFNTQQKFVFNSSKDIDDNRDLYSLISNLKIEL